MTADEKIGRYPLFLDVRRRRCLVIGGGEVALRKVRTLLECGAAVEVISPELCPGLEDITEEGRISYQRRGYRSGEIKDAVLVFAATGDAGVNRSIAGEAKQAGIPVNVTDDAELSDFIVPSSTRRGGIAVAVSTGGLSPALAHAIRLKLETALDESYAALVLLVGRVRDELIRQGVHVDGEKWQEALDLDELVSLLRQGREDAAGAVLTARLTNGRGGGQ